MRRFKILLNALKDCCDAMGWTHRARQEYEECRTSVEISEWKTKRRWEDNIKMNHREVWQRRGFIWLEERPRKHGKKISSYISREFLEKLRDYQLASAICLKIYLMLWTEFLAKWNYISCDRLNAKTNLTEGPLQGCLKSKQITDAPPNSYF
jgi:hypothetical protein